MYGPNAINAPRPVSCFPHAASSYIGKASLTIQEVNTFHTGMKPRRFLQAYPFWETNTVDIRGFLLPSCSKMHGKSHGQGTYWSEWGCTQGPSLDHLIPIGRSQVNIFDQMRRMNEKPMCSLSQQRYIRTFSVKMYIRVRIPYKFNCSLPHLPHLPQFFKHRPKLHASTYILELSTNPPRRQWLQQIRPQSRSSQSRPKWMTNMRLSRIRPQTHLLPDIFSRLPQTRQ